ncbi:predicted protein [Coccidioides posadasii str. Silveira]|uniref:Predicted protein n=1 Tax=Coccidioides posadasii (strain RMSCC 757 / Silveira) TaxID=443226 RepID=E9DHR8_COCPS|nr:predicted protein [Coccidioides posadasii str. Silveira]
MSAFASHPAPAYTSTKRADVFAVLPNERARKDAVPLAAPLNEEEGNGKPALEQLSLKNCSYATAFALLAIEIDSMEDVYDSATVIGEGYSVLLRHLYSVVN